MISVDEATRRISDSFKPVASELVPTADALGRVLAETVAARLSHPPSAVSAMDGYAIHADDVKGVPERLQVVGAVPAGASYDHIVGPGEAVRIFTGATMPEGADTVVIQEDTEEADGFVTINLQPKPGRHIRPLGMDFMLGQTVLQAGTRLTARHLALAAAANRASLMVRRRPRVAILATGNEVVLPGEPVGPGQIISSNSFLIAGIVEGAGGIPVHLGIARDDVIMIRAMAEQGLGADVLVTSGGASVGEFDLVQKALAQIGLAIDFWKIAMKPGKPLMFGHVGDTGVFGLPGNPVSAFVCSLLFLIPALERLQGLPIQTPLIEQAVTGAPLEPVGIRQEYLRASLAVNDGGVLTAMPATRQDSALLTVLAEADALIVRRPNSPAAVEGDTISIIRFPRGLMLV